MPVSKTDTEELVVILGTYTKTGKVTEMLEALKRAQAYMKNKSYRVTIDRLAAAWEKAKNAT